MTALQKIPQVGDVVEIEEKRITIVEMVGQRMAKVRLESVPCRCRSKRADRLLKNAHLPCCPHPSSLRSTFKYVSLLRIWAACIWHF